MILREDDVWYEEVIDDGKCEIYELDIKFKILRCEKDVVVCEFVDLVVLRLRKEELEDKEFVF